MKRISFLIFSVLSVSHLYSQDDPVAIFNSHIFRCDSGTATLQQLGTILSVVFALALVQIAGTSKTLAGRLTLLTSTIITSLSLAEGTFALGAVQAGDNGHLESALTCFDLTNVFVHIFLLAPSLFLMLGFSLRGTTILPKFFVAAAITLGVLFQFLGVVALFYNQLLSMVIGILMLQNVWTIAASIILLARNKSSST